MRLNILAFACGIALLQFQEALPSTIMIMVSALLATTLVAVAQCGRRPAFRLVLVIACALLGWVWAAGMAHLRLADNLPPEWELRDIRVTGLVNSLPQRFERGERFAFDVESVGTRDAVVPGRILLSWYHGWDEADETEAEAAIPDRAVRPGERWSFTVRLKRPHGNANPHGFDYEAWLLERNIRATGTIRSGAVAQRLESFVWRPGTIVERLRDEVRTRFLSALPNAPYAGVLMALAIGDQRAIPAAQWQVFSRTGVTHLMSISGLHVTMVAALLAFLINLLWRRSEVLMLCLPAQKAAVLAGWMGAFGYALLAGFEVPAQRTFYMLCVVALALFSGRNIGVSRTLLLALLAVLVLDPWAVLATGFWLSFGAVAVLFFVSVSRSGSNGRDTDWKTTVVRWGGAQWAVTVGSLPLLLFFFQQFSLVSPLANALAIPVISFIITPLALIFSVIAWPPLLHADHWLLAQLMTGLEWLARWPLWQQPAPPLWASAVALGGVFWMLLPKGVPARWSGTFLILPALLWPAPRPLSGEAWVDVLDVGQGLAVLVRTARHALLYDTGPMYSADSNAGQRVVLPFLRASGIRQLDTLVVSHRDKDHSGGAQAILDALPVTRTLTSITEWPGIERCVAGQSWEWDGVSFDVLHPSPENYEIKSRNTNSMSCVLRIATEGGQILLTADIEAADERSLVSRSGPLLSSSVLLVPHHGGRGSSTPEFIAAVEAREAVFSTGYRNAFGHPRAEVLERHAASRSWRTDRDGAIHIVLADGVHVSAWRRERIRYWSGR